MFSYMSPEQRVPAEYPLGALCAMMDDILKEMSRRFAKLYADTGRPSIPPEGFDSALAFVGQKGHMSRRPTSK
jgi:hypothetical protein